MKLSDEVRGGHTVLRVSGTISLGDTSRALHDHFEMVATERTGAMILDLSGLEHLDSTAVGVLVGGLRLFEAQGRRFYLVNPRERVASVFHITHLDSVFRTFGTVEGAIASANLAQDEETSEH